MIDPLWLRRILCFFALVTVVIAAGYSWFRVDWLDFAPAQPPDSIGETVIDPHTESLVIRINELDALSGQPRVMAGDSLNITGALKLDSEFWAVPLTQGQSIMLSQTERERIRMENQNKVRPVVSLHIVRKSWLAPGEKDTKSLVGTVNRANSEEIIWKTSCQLRHPGVYLVRFTVAEREASPENTTNPLLTITNERTLKTFLLTVDPYEPTDEQG